MSGLRGLSSHDNGDNENITSNRTDPCYLRYFVIIPTCFTCTMCTNFIGTELSSFELTKTVEQNDAFLQC